MIEIFISKSSPEFGFVWNVQGKMKETTDVTFILKSLSSVMVKSFCSDFFSDVFTLREDHRVVGSLSGCLPRAPRQENFLGVPLLLSPEEIDLLVNHVLLNYK